MTLDYISIFRKFNEEKIKYIVVGGLAVNLLGIPRMTYDLDLLIDLEDENLRKFLALLNKWGFKPKVPVDIMDFAKHEIRTDWIENKNMKAFCLINHSAGISEIDIIIDSPVKYNDAIKKVENINLDNVLIHVISINDLIQMKKDTGRQQDKADIRYLKEIKREKK